MWSSRKRSRADSRICPVQICLNTSQSDALLTGSTPVSCGSNRGHLVNTCTFRWLQASLLPDSRSKDPSIEDHLDISAFRDIFFGNQQGIGGVLDPTNHGQKYLAKTSSLLRHGIELCHLLPCHHRYIRPVPAHCCTMGPQGQG